MYSFIRTKQTKLWVWRRHLLYFAKGHMNCVVPLEHYVVHNFHGLVFKLLWCIKVSWHLGGYWTTIYFCHCLSLRSIKKLLLHLNIRQSDLDLRRAFRKCKNVALKIFHIQKKIVDQLWCLKHICILYKIKLGLHGNVFRENRCFWQRSVKTVLIEF